MTSEIVATDNSEPDHQRNRQVKLRPERKDVIEERYKKLWRHHLPLAGVAIVMFVGLGYYIFSKVEEVFIRIVFKMIFFTVFGLLFGILLGKNARRMWEEDDFAFVSVPDNRLIENYHWECFSWKLVTVMVWIFIVLDVFSFLALKIIDLTIATIAYMQLFLRRKTSRCAAFIVLLLSAYMSWASADFTQRGALNMLCYYSAAAWVVERGIVGEIIGGLLGGIVFGMMALAVTNLLGGFLVGIFLLFVPMSEQFIDNELFTAFLPFEFVVVYLFVFHGSLRGRLRAIERKMRRKAIFSMIR